MSDKDLTISVASFTNQGTITKRPSYLILLTEDVPNKTKPTLRKFVSLDKPELLEGFIQVKGVFLDETEETITKDFTELLTKTSKELFCEYLFPWHKVCSIKSLVFKAK